MGATTRQGYRVVGEADLPQTLGAMSWRIPHSGFYQTNEPLAGLCSTWSHEEAGAFAHDRLLDLYCGAGFFGVRFGRGGPPRSSVSKRTSQSVEARRPTRALAGSAQRAYSPRATSGAVLAGLSFVPREVAVVDPPREVCCRRALQAIVELGLPIGWSTSRARPRLWRRDLKVRARRGLAGVSRCTPVDMFPHSSHLEVGGDPGTVKRPSFSLGGLAPYYARRASVKTEAVCRLY